MERSADDSGHLGVVRSMVFTFFGQIMAYAQGLIVMPIVIRWAGVGTYGAYVLLTMLLGMAYGLSSLGIGYRYKRGLVSTHDPAARRRLFEPQFTFQALMLCALAAAVMLAAPHLDRWLFDDKARFAPWLAVAWLAAIFLYSQAADYFRYTNRFSHFNLAAASYPYLFVAMVVASAASGWDISVDLLLLLQVVAYVIVTLPLLVLIVREIGLPRWSFPVRALIADGRIGFPLTFEFAVDFLLGSADRYLISFFLSVDDVGRYQPGYQLGSLVTFFPRVGGVVLPTAVARLLDQGDRAGAERLTDRFVHYFLMVAIPFAVGALMLGPSLVGALATPPVGLASRWVTPLIGLASIFYGITLIMCQIAFVLGRTRSTLWTNAAGAALKVALTAAVLPVVLDITVPAAMTVVGYGASCVLMLLSLRRMWVLTIAWRDVLRFCVAAALMAAVLWLMGCRPAVVAVMPLGRLVIMAIVAVAGYFAALAGLGGFGRRDLQWIAAVLGWRTAGNGKVA